MKAEANNNRKTVFLFDIDGTLLLTGGAGARAMQRTMRESYRLGQLARIEVHGRTDRSIIGNLFEAHDLELDDNRYEAFRDSYHRYLESEILESSGQPLPGVLHCLERLNSIPNVYIGLLTGNSKRAAEIKISHYQLTEVFHFEGGFGDRHSQRDDVARAALDCCCDFLGESIEPENVWVVGDTVHDITCARAIQANVIAVETGGVPRAELHAAAPNLLLENLTLHEQIVEVAGLQYDSPMADL